MRVHMNVRALHACLIFQDMLNLRGIYPRQ
jgi:hypothetical protein